MRSTDSVVSFSRQRSLAVGVVLLVALGVAWVGPSSTAGAAGSQTPGLTVSTAVSSLDKPWDIGFTPDGTMLFTIKSGAIKARIGSTTVQLGVPPDVVSLGEAGMLGLAIDPDFATNRRIYTCFLSRSSGRPDDVRLVRWHVKPGYAGLDERADIVTGMPVNTLGSAGRHSGCRPRFSPLGNLWIGTGDAAMPKVAQNKRSLGGKVLRVDTNGAGVAGNPGVDSPGSGFLPQIYTYGHRNVQGIAFRPSDGKAYSVEHGTGCNDEVNLLMAGSNYGWDPVSPGNPNLYDESKPMTDLAKFPTAKVAVWSSGCPTIAPSGATFVSGAQWLGWEDALAISVLKGSELLVLNLNAAGTAVTKSTVRITDQGRLRSAVQGPDGNLYIARDSGSGSILKVKPEASCGQPGTGPFTDVAGDHPFCADINWLSLASIGQGYSDGSFRPTDVVSRQAMASFLHKFGGSPPVTVPTPVTFDDVGVGHQFSREIEWLAQREIASGFADGGFHPLDAVSRQAMASFIYNYADKPAFKAPDTPTFGDVDPGSPFYVAIEWMVAEGYATGFAAETFGPTLPVTRQGAAAFLHRAEEIR